MKNANQVSGSPWFARALAFAALGVALALAGCARDDAVPASVSADGEASASRAAVPRTINDWFPVAVGGRAVRMQLALTTAEQERGLMGRRDLQPDEGMIFVFAQKPRRQVFWMRNTPTALDVGYFTADGALAEVYPMYPFDETPVPSRSDAIAYALEMNQGWFSAHGVKPGARLDMDALAAAIQARGGLPATRGAAE